MMWSDRKEVINSQLMIEVLFKIGIMHFLKCDSI